MEITSTALVSLACLLSSGKTDPKVTQDFANSLTEQKVVVIQRIIESGACLPKSFEDKVQPISADKPIVGSPTSDL